jgi:hypothetical protein
MWNCEATRRPSENQKYPAQWANVLLCLEVPGGRVYIGVLFIINFKIITMLHKNKLKKLTLSKKAIATLTSRQAMQAIGGDTTINTQSKKETGCDPVSAERNCTATQQQTNTQTARLPFPFPRQ